jgi:hypothetical protein
MKYEKNKNYQKFVNEILDDVIMTSEKVTDYQFFEQTGQFTFFTSKGVFDYYAQSDKIHFRNKNKWEINGLKQIFKLLSIIQ